MPHYYSKKQNSDLRLIKINVQLKEDLFQLFSGSGVFSKKKLDRGTELLINNMIIKDEWKVLDLGCGIGVVGIYVKRNYPDSEVMMTDVNTRAVKLARKNVELHKLDIDVKDSDGFKKIKKKFDCVLLNPPQSAGKDLCFRLIENSFEHLKPDGKLQLVARHNKGGRHLSKKIEEVFGNMEVVAKGSGYRIYMGSKE